MTAPYRLSERYADLSAMAHTAPFHLRIVRRAAKLTVRLRHEIQICFAVCEAFKILRLMLHAERYPCGAECQIISLASYNLQKAEYIFSVLRTGLSYIYIFPASHSMPPYIIFFYIIYLEGHTVNKAPAVLYKLSAESSILPLFVPFSKEKCPQAEFIINFLNYFQILVLKLRIIAYIILTLKERTV